MQFEEEKEHLNQVRLTQGMFQAPLLCFVFSWLAISRSWCFPAPIPARPKSCPVFLTLTKAPLRHLPLTISSRVVHQGTGWPSPMIYRLPPQSWLRPSITEWTRVQATSLVQVQVVTYLRDTGVLTALSIAFSTTASSAIFRR